MSEQQFGQITVRIELSSSYLGDQEMPRTVLVAKPGKIEEKVLAWIRQQTTAALQRNEDFLAARAEMRRNGQAPVLSPWRPSYESGRTVPRNYRGD